MTQPLRIAHLFPDLLNLYGDGGNVTCLVKRCEWRGIPVEVVPVTQGKSLDMDTVDLVFLGGGPDREQRLASEGLMGLRTGLAHFVEQDGAVLAICGGFQILGREWLLGKESVAGLALIDMVTKRSSQEPKRLVGNVAVLSPFSESPLVGYENHAGRTYLGIGVEPLGRVVSARGHGNNDTDGTDGARYRNIIGTYLHGPLLAKNPEIADVLLRRALARRTARTGLPGQDLPPLDDRVESDARAYLLKRMNV